MICFIEGDRLEEQEYQNKVDFRPCLAILDPQEMEVQGDYLQLPGYLFKECFAGQCCKLESHEGFDYIALSMPNKDGLTGPNRRLAVYYRHNLLAFLCEDEAGSTRCREFLHSAMEKGIRSLSLERILCEFFNEMTAEDAGYLEEIEQEVFELEEALIREKDGEYIPRIIDLRRRLLVLKRYYEQLLDIAEAIEENENDLFSGGVLRMFHMFTSHVDRLTDSVNNLRDYISQVREAYQAQVDIKQNEIMKLFTVITAIFLPLSLIAGWYGMNLQMPEFRWAAAYPAVIGISIAIAAGCFLYFKKHKWF